MSDRWQGEHSEADGLDRLIDGVVAGEPGDQPGQETTGDRDGIVASLRRVRALADEPLPAASRDRHLLRIRTEAPPPGQVQPGRAGRAPSGSLRRLRRRLVPLTAGAIALVLLAGGGTVAAAQNAGPDDPLYGLKRTSERAWVALPLGSERAVKHLTLAERRITEADQAPDHAEELLAAGLDNVEAAADERPEEAIRTFIRLLGDGEDSLPEQASPAARAALHRNCVRIADQHDLGPERCGPAPEFAHPGRGRGQGRGPGDGPPGWGPGGRPEGVEGPPPGVRGEDGEHPGRGWGPGGRPEGVEGPPPGVPGLGRDDGNGDDDGE